MAASRSAFFLLVIIYLGFISLGLPDGTLGIAWPQMYPELRLPIGTVGAIMVVITVLSGISGFCSGGVIARFKTGPVVFASCAATGGALMLIARASNLWWLLLAAIPLGLGAGAVDAGLNGYVARHFSGRQMNWLHACWGMGATAGPLLMGAMIHSGSGWRGGYFAISAGQLSLAAVFLLTLRLWNTVPERRIENVDASSAAARVPEAKANSAAGWLSIGIFMAYTAVEATVGLWAGSILIVERGIATEVAASCAAGFYGVITAGRIGGGVVVDRLGNRRVIALGGALAFVGAVMFALSDGALLSGVALVLFGLGLAPIYPCLMHEVPRRFAPEAVQTMIGRQSGAGAIGMATLPAAAGWIAEFSLEAITWVAIAGVLGLIAAIRRLNQLT